MREAFYYQLALRLVDWIFEKPWPHLLVVLLLLPPLWLARRWLSQNKSVGRGKGRRTTGAQPAFQIPTPATWGRWVGAIALFGCVVWSTMLLVDAYRVRRTALHLSWQAREYYQAICMGIQGAPLNADGQEQNVEHWMPTYAWYNRRLRLIMSTIGVHELVQKGVIEDQPIKPTEEDPQWVPAGITPTPFGKRLCNYFLSKTR